MEQLSGAGDEAFLAAAVIERLFAGRPTRVLGILDRLAAHSNRSGPVPAGPAAKVDPLVLAESIGALGTLLAGDFVRGTDRARAAVGLAQHQATTEPVRQLAAGVAAWAGAMSGRPVAVLSDGPGGTEGSTAIRPGPLATVITFLRAESAMSDGDLDRAEAEALSGLAGVPDGSVLVFYLRLTLARALLFQGRLAQARDVAEELLPMAGRRGPAAQDLSIGLARACQALIDASEGETVRACVRVEQALAAVPAGDLDPHYFRSGVSTLCAFALSAAGLAGRAAAVLLAGAGGPELPRIQAVDRAFGFEMLTSAALDAGDVSGAAEWVQRGAALAAGWAGDPAGMAGCALDRAAARLAAALGSTDRSLQLAQNAAASAASAGGRLEVARALLIAGAAQAGSNRGEAIADLERAADVAGEIGASPVLGEAARQLREFGRRVPPRPGGGLAVLSERERQVAAQLAAGRSNQQIAGQLHLSVRTVAAHVTRVLRAFGVHSRWAVAAVLAEAGSGGAAVPGAGAATRPPLAGRQAQVASLTALGWSNGRIGGELSISVKTVEKHLTQVYEQWQISSRAELAALIHGPDRP